MNIFIKTCRKNECESGYVRAGVLFNITCRPAARLLVNRPDPETDLSVTSSAEFQIAWSYTYTLPCIFNDVINHRDSCTFFCLGV